MNPEVLAFLAAIDAGRVPPAEAETAMRQQGGLVYLVLNLLIP